MRMYLIYFIGIQYPRERREVLQSKGLIEINYSVKVYYKDIKNLCSSVRNMGEPILNPEAENAESGTNVPDLVNNPGYSILSICEKKITTAAYTSRIYDTVGSNISIQNLGIAGIQKYEYHRLLID